MNEESWARVGLRITNPAVPRSELEERLGRKSMSKPGQAWAADIVEDSSIELTEQLRMAAAYLIENVTVLEALRQSEIDLCISWTPRNPQDGIALGTDLIEVLARVRGRVLLDTYID